MTHAAANVTNERADYRAAAPDAVDCRIINRLQKGLPLAPHPYRAIADELGLDETALLARLQAMLDSGLLTRFGPMYQIERAGGRFTLAAIAVPPARFDEVAAIVNGFPEVAHNYERTHRLNMWFVVGTATPEQCAGVLRRIEAATGLPVLDMPKEREFRVHLYFEARP